MFIASLFLLSINLILFPIFYFVIRKNFSESAYEQQLKDKIGQFLVDFDSQADQSITVLEKKIEQLQALIDKADHRIIIAAKEEQKRINEKNILQNLVKRPDEAASIRQSEDSGDDGIKSLSKTESLSVYGKQNSVPSGILCNGMSSYKDQIVEMALKGISIELIAEKVPIPRGEIEVIISMNT